MEYGTLQEANRARQEEWLGGTRLPLTFRTNELAGEFGEVCELLLDRWVDGQHMYAPWRDALADEVADVIICCEIVAWQLGGNIDYERAEALARRIGNDYQWAAKVSRDIGLLCNAAKKYDRNTFGIAGGMPPEQVWDLIMRHLNEVVRDMYDRIYHEQFRADVSIARKFNRTSAKVGLNTYYVPPGVDRGLVF